MSRLNSSILNLKLKAEKRNVKKNKIEKILFFLYHEKDHTAKLRQGIHEMYLSRDFLNFLNNPEQARVGIISTNPKLDLNDDKVWQKTKLLVGKINPGELSPNTEELEFLVSEIDWRSGGLNKKEKMIVKDALVKIYEERDDQFPTKEDLLTELLKQKLSEKILKKLQDSSFSSIAMPSSEEFFFNEEQAEKFLFEALNSLKTKGTSYIEARQLEFILNSDSIKKSLDLILKNKDYDYEIDKYRGNLSINLKTHKVNELKTTNIKEKNKTEEFKNLIDKAISSGKECCFSSNVLRREYGSVIMKEIPFLLKEVHKKSPISVKILKREDKNENINIYESLYLLIISPQDIQEVETEFINEIQKMKI